MNRQGAKLAKDQGTEAKRGAFTTLLVTQSNLAFLASWRFLNTGRLKTPAAPGYMRP
jgi:hypothetical protein